MRRFPVFTLLLSVFFIWQSCADDTEVGSGLLGSEDIDVVFTDDFNLSIRHIAPAPIKISPAQYYSLGTLDNDAFGFMSSSFYVRPVLDSRSVSPNFVGAVLDSAVLALKIDSTRIYGNPKSLFNIEVFELLESIDNIDTFTSDQVFVINPDPLGVVERLVPENIDSILTYDQFGDTTYFQDVITIPIDRRFAGKIFLDTANNDNISGFLTLLNGFYVQATSTNTLVQVDLLNEVTSLLYYYKDSSGVNRTYPYRFNLNAPLNFEYDSSGSQLETASNEPDPEFYYLQGHAGGILEIDVEDALKLDDPFINHASIELYAQLDGVIDTSIFNLPFALDLLRLNNKGELVSVIDLAIGQEQGQTRGIFDGELETDTRNGTLKYEMNITTHLKQIYEGRQSTKMFIAVRSRTQTPNNLIIYGPNHPTYPIRLKLTHTKL